MDEETVKLKLKLVHFAEAEPAQPSAGLSRQPTSGSPLKGMRMVGFIEAVEETGKKGIARQVTKFVKGGMVHRLACNVVDENRIKELGIAVEEFGGKFLG